MTPEEAAAHKATIETILAVFNGNAGGFVIMALLVLALGWGVYKLGQLLVGNLKERIAALEEAVKGCREEHAQCTADKNKLAQALLDHIEGRRHEAKVRTQDVLASTATMVQPS